MSFETFRRAAASFDDAPPVAAPVAPATSPFAALGLAAPIVSAIERAGYAAPTDVQSRSVPLALEGRDLLVSAHTGSGKTAAFVWPALQRVLAARQDPSQRRAKGVASGPRLLVLAPTRELALQVTRACTVYGGSVPGLRVASVVGGVPYGAQLKALRGPLDLLVATPGRLMDLMRGGHAVLAQVQMLVLDEADRMLDMGFIDDIRLIAQALPAQRQTLMFSATFGGPVGELARGLTRDARRVDVAGHTDRHAQIEQRLYWADSPGHRHALLEHLLVERDLDQALVFTSTQREADQLADRLADMGHPVASLHGGMPQGRRNRVLTDLRQRRLRVLVATDVAARGIDVPTITHVFNVGLPMKAEDYVHRIGRTGRAGRMGLAITLAERRDTPAVRRIERFTTQRIAEATVPGMEPRPAPKVVHARPAARPGARRGPQAPGKARAPAGRGGPRR
jgi:superfamily II DNA/RNA helicase